MTFFQKSLVGAAFPRKGGARNGMAVQKLAVRLTLNDRPMPGSARSTPVAALSASDHPPSGSSYFWFSTLSMLASSVM